MVNFAFTVLRGAAIAAGVLSVTACATLPEASSTMQFAREAAAPRGFLEFCERSADHCTDAGATHEDLARARTQAWRVAFQMAEAQPASPPAAIGDLGGASSTEAAALTTAEVSADVEVLEPIVVRAQSKPVLTDALWTTLNDVNRSINHRLLRRADAVGYGREDYWAMPLSTGASPYGDCEDYVLEKRRALIAAGVKPSALSIAIATTQWGETHAVLLVDTDRGEYVLDNLSSFIAPWRKVGYTWRERQFGATFEWGFAASVRDARLTLAAGD